MYAVGIYNFSTFDYTDRKLVVGESFDFSGTDTRNSFQNIKYDIWSQNESVDRQHKVYQT